MHNDPVRSATPPEEAALGVCTAAAAQALSRRPKTADRCIDESLLDLGRLPAPTLCSQQRTAWSRLFASLRHGSESVSMVALGGSTMAGHRCRLHCSYFDQLAEWMKGRWMNQTSAPCRILSPCSRPSRVYCEPAPSTRVALASSFASLTGTRPESPSGTARRAA